MKLITKYKRIRKMHKLINKNKNIICAFCELLPDNNTENKIVIMAIPKVKNDYFRKEYEVEPTIKNLIKIYKEVIEKCKE